MVIYAHLCPNYLHSHFFARPSEYPLLCTRVLNYRNGYFWDRKMYVTSFFGSFDTLVIRLTLNTDCFSLNQINSQDEPPGYVADWSIRAHLSPLRSQVHTSIYFLPICCNSCSLICFIKPFTWTKYSLLNSFVHFGKTYISHNVWFSSVYESEPFFLCFSAIIDRPSYISTLRRTWTSIVKSDYIDSQCVAF